MRIAILALGLIFAVLVLIQSALVMFGGLFFDVTAVTVGGVLGIIVSALLAAGAILAMTRPPVSFIIFALAGLTGIVAGLATFTELIFWGAAALALSGMSYYLSRTWTGERPVKAGGQARTPGQF